MRILLAIVTIGGRDPGLPNAPFFVKFDGMILSVRFTVRTFETPFSSLPCNGNTRIAYLGATGEHTKVMKLLERKFVFKGGTTIHPSDDVSCGEGVRVIERSKGVGIETFGVSDGNGQEEPALGRRLV